MGSLRVGHNWATSLSLFTVTYWSNGVAQSRTRLKRLSSSSSSALGTQLQFNRLFFAPFTVYPQSSCQKKPFKMLNWIMWETLWWLPTVLRTEVREITTNSVSYAETYSGHSLPPHSVPAALLCPFGPLHNGSFCLKHSILYSHVTLKFFSKFYHHNEAYLDHLI